MSAETVPTVRYEPYGIDNLEDPSAVRDLWFVNDDIDGVEALRSSGVLDESVAVASVDFDRLDMSDLAVLPQARTHVVYPAGRSPEWVRDTLRAFGDVRQGHVAHHPFDVNKTPDPLHEVAAGRRPKGMGGEVLFAARSQDQTAPDRRLRDDLYLTLPELDSIPETTWLIDEEVQANGLISLIGPPGVGKSAVAVGMSCSLATGRPWAGRQVTKVKVLYMIGESARQIADRTSAWAEANGTTLAEIGDGIATLDRAFPLVPGPELDELIEIIREIQPGLIVTDTLARYAVGLEENSARDMGLFVEVLDRLRRVCGTSVMTVHHTTRGTSHGRGSTAMNGAADTELLVEEDPDAPDDGPRRIRIRNTKQKNSKQAAPLTFVFEQVGGSFVLEPCVVTNRHEAALDKACQVILENVRAAGEPITKGLAKEGVGNATNGKKAVDMLVAGKHLIEVPSGGRYPLVALGPEPYAPPATGGVAFDARFNTRFVS